MIQFIAALSFYLVRKKRYLKYPLSFLFAIAQYYYFGLNSDLSEYFTRTTLLFNPWVYVEPLFWVPFLLARSLFSTEVTYLLLYILINLLLFKVIEKYTLGIKDLFVFFVPFAVFGYSNIIRQYVAVLLFLLLSKSKSKTALVAALVHNASVLYLPFLKKSTIYLLLFLAVISFFFKINFGSNLDNSINLSWLYIAISLCLSFVQGLRIVLYVFLLSILSVNVLSYDMIERVFNGLIFIQLIYLPKSLGLIRTTIGIAFLIVGLFLPSYVRFL